MLSTHLFAWAFALSFLTLTGYVIYQVKFHPLARYPGPFLAKVTHLYAAYHAWKQDIHLDMWRCHLKYGDYVRYGPDRVLINTATGLRDIYGTSKNVVKSRGYNAMIHRTPSVLTIRDRKEHSDRRKLIGLGLSDSAIRGHEQTIQRHVDRLAEMLAPSDGSWSGPQNMAGWANCVAFDIMAEVVFGLKYDLIGSKKYRYVVDAIAYSNIRTTVLLYFPKLVFQRLDKKLFPASIKARNAFLLFMKKLLTECYTLSTPGRPRSDVFSALLKVRDADTGKTLNAEQVTADSTTLVIAGSDTTATALAAVFFYLSRHPHAHRRARDEVRAAFATRADIRVGQPLNACTYLRACIDESMRLTPPIGASLFREAGPGGVCVDGRCFPQGVDVGTSIYSIHRNPAYYPRPHVFMPERWLVADDGDGLGVSREEVRRAQSALNAFSMGPRGCVGKSIAIVELMLIMATTLWEFDFRPVEGPQGEIGGGDPVKGELGRHDPDEYQLYHGGVTSIKNGPMLQFSRRVPAAAAAAAATA